MAMRVTKKWHGATADAAAVEGAIQGLHDATEFLLGEAQKVVPHQEGILESTGAASVDDSELRGAVSFDGPYSVVQHEALDYRHDPGRTAKYLENPFNSEQPIMTGLIAAAIRRALQS